MLRTLVSFSTMALLAATASAQCLNTSSIGTSIGSGDEVLFAPAAMGISFPMAGAVGGPFTHCVAGTNGVLYLTTGGAAVGAVANQHGTVAQLRGAVGDSPRIAPFWTDLVCAAPASYVAIDTSIAGRCAITWLAANEFLQTPTKSFQAELFSSGVVRFSYAAGMAVDAIPTTVGVSIGNAVADPGVSDLSAAPVATTGIAYQSFDPSVVPFDLANRTISFTPSGPGYTVGTACEAASHSSFGTGCYALARESFHQFFATAAAASAALNGQSMRLVPTASGYSVTWGGGTYVAPTGAAVVLTANDDDEVAIAPSIALPIPGGNAPVLYVHTNGFVSTGAGNDAGYGLAAWNPPTLEDYAPSAQFRNAPATAFWSWHDYNATSGTGRIKREEANVAGNQILYVTWDAVESYPSATANPSTFQFQFNLTTGAVTYVWQSITAIGTGGDPFFPESHLVGYSPGGASLDGGSITLAAALPLTTAPDVKPLTLSAAPAPVNNGVAGTTVTYTIGNVPEYIPSAGFYVATMFLSTASLPGVDLGFLGAPGCPAYIASLDVNLACGPLLSSTQTATFFYPPGGAIPPGTDIWCQAVGLFDAAYPLPNGQNAFGLTTSNGVRSHVGAF